MIEIGENTVLAGEAVKFGERVVIGPNCSIGQAGFGYEELEDGSWRRKPHPYGVVIGDDVEIGANTTIARGRHRDTVIGAGTKIDDHVFIAHNVHIGRNCLIIANAGIAGTVEIGEGVIVGLGVQIRDHVKVGARALLGAGAVVVSDVPASAVMVGNPAKVLRSRLPDDLK